MKNVKKCKNTCSLGHRKFFILSIVTLLLLCGAASAATVTYRYLPSTGTTVATGVTTNFNCPTTYPTTYSKALLTTSSSGGCGATRQYGTNLDPALDTFYNTAYSENTNVAGNWVYGRMRDGSTGGGTFTFRLIYIYANGTIATLPGTPATQTVASASSADYNVSLSGMSGVVPAGAKLGLRVSLTGSSTQLRWYVGDNASTASTDSGIFSVTETPAGGGTPTYNLSGYITNKSNGTGLYQATVQINTTPTPTTVNTNSQGYYLFTGLSNGSYLINASLTGYAINSTTTSISGADKPNINISLSPIPTYLLSGYVTNKSNGSVISGAIVTINTTAPSTTTNATGYYNFTVGNGTYLITASKTGFSDNSTTRTINGAAVSNANISLTPVPPAPPQTGGKILVATNRFVILDDWTTAASLGTGFSLPGATHTANSWTGINTKINATALFIDDSGSPLSGKIVTFNLYDPNNAEYVTARVNSTTNAYGLANFSFDMNARNYYGNWTVKASNSSINDSTSFIYNWWGCGIGGCDSGHVGRNPSGTATINSPYLSGRDTTISQDGAHTTACTNCHQSFDGKPGANAIGGTNHTNNPKDVHKSVACDNVNCHQTISTHSTNAVIGSCYNTACHTPVNRSDISNKSTLSGVLSIYSSNNGSNAAFHTPNSTVPCFICHGPMHNISKPDATQLTRNSDTESSHCTTCHTTYSKHNNGVNCTVCHSDDVHAIKVFAQNATYITLNKNNPNSYRGNCTNCHQNATFFNTLKSNPKAGSYTGTDPRLIPTPLNHSTNPYSGALWNGSQSAYWTNTTQSSACNYCHGLPALHNASALGKIQGIQGNNNLNQSLIGGTWCQNCHYKNAPDYAGDLFNPMPPEVLNLFGLVPLTARDGTGFVNHSSFLSTSSDDDTCYDCHKNSALTSTSLNFSHNVNKGSGGAPNCIQCHNLVTGLSGGAPVGINFTTANASVHFGMNSNNATSQGYAPIVGACWACHDTDGNVASGHPDKKDTPKICSECHLSSGAFYSQAVNWGGLTVTEHYYSGAQIRAGNSSSNIVSCINCHENVSEMILYNNDTDTGSFSGDGVRLTGGSLSYYHYGKLRTDLRSWNSGNTENCSYCHQNASTAFAGAMVNAAYNKSVQNHSLSNSPTCFNSTCHSTGWLHNSSLTKPVLPLPNTTFCQNCHAIKQKHNNTQDCSKCHINTASSDTIHPIKFIQANGSFAATRTAAANCTNCHQAKLTGFTTAPIIPDPLKHSANITNGTIWGIFWTSESGSCYYCHNDTKHNATALGKVNALYNTNNVKNGSLTTTGWCADCHYNASINTNYKGNQWNPVPPLVNVDNTGKVRWFNHSDSLASGYNDSVCTACHSLNGSYSSTTLNYSHSLDEGKGCTGCHAQPPSGTIRYNMTGAHDLHKTKGYGSVPETSCDYCHSTGGRNEGSHPNTNDNATVVTNGSASIGTYVMNLATGNDDTCSGVSCHSNGLSTAAKVGTATWDSTTAGACNECHSTVPTGLPPTGNHTKHYTTKGYSCAECHGTNADAGTQPGHKTNATIDINFTNVTGSISSGTCTVYCH
ncbi:MAG TPA: CxxxxCH/CxxCH domain-containing protein, partial [Candidatus Limnocylindrales bacterium]|nr:CxxxxCH/CxxCH domain-containing protein [Candidatus Limnocylindrales bacterium]